MMWVPQKKLKQSYHIIQEFSFSVFMKNTNFKRYMCFYVHCSIIYNRLKEECLKHYGLRFVTLYRRPWPKSSPRKRNARRQNSCWRRPYKWKRKGEKWKARRNGKIYLSECRVPKNSRRDKKVFLCEQWKEIEERNRMGKTRDLFKKSGDTKGTFHGHKRWAQ